MYRTQHCEEKPWSHEEKSAVQKHLSRFIKMMKVSGKKDCAEAVELESALQCRSWEAVNYDVYKIRKLMIFVGHKRDNRKTYIFLLYWVLGV